MTTSRSYDVQRGAFTKAKINFDQFSSDLKSTMSKLQGELAMLLSKSTYDGQGAYQFLRAYQELDRSMKGASIELGIMSNQIHQSLVSYTAGDSEVADSFRNVGNLIGQSPDSGRIAGAL